MEKVLHWLQKVENVIMIIAFIVMLLSSFAQVLNRNTFQLGIGWFEELSRYCMIYMALLATEIGLRDNTQMSITAATDHMKGKIKEVVSIVARIVVIIFFGILFFSSFDLLKVQISYGQISPGLRLPMYIPYFALTLSSGIIVIVQIAMLIIMIKSTAIMHKGEGEET